MQSNQPNLIQRHEIYLQERRIERELEDRKLNQLKAQLRRMILEPTSHEQAKFGHDSQAA